MTTPHSASPTVAENNHLSTCSFCGMKLLSTHASGVLNIRDVHELSTPEACVPKDLFFEYSSPVLETLEHVKAGASWREQNNVAAFGRCERSRHCLMHAARTFKRHGILQFLFDRLRVFADQNHLAHEFSNQWRQRSIRRVLTAAAENQNNFAGVL